MKKDKGLYTSKKDIAQAKKLLKAIEVLGDEYFTRLLIEQWNNDAPHFGGDAPHRYDGSEKQCCYCLRPKDWQKVNSGVFVGQLFHGDLAEILANKGQNKKGA